MRSTGPDRAWGQEGVASNKAEEDTVANKAEQSQVWLRDKRRRSASSKTTAPTWAPRRTNFCASEARLRQRRLKTQALSFNECLLNGYHCRFIIFYKIYDWMNWINFTLITNTRIYIIHDQLKGVISKFWNFLYYWSDLYYWSFHTICKIKNKTLFVIEHFSI